MVRKPARKNAPRAGVENVKPKRRTKRGIVSVCIVENPTLFMGPCNAAPHAVFPYMHCFEHVGRNAPVAGCTVSPTFHAPPCAPLQVALREIRLYQKSTNHLIPKAPFARLVKEICQNTEGNKGPEQIHRWTRVALEALQEGVEAYAVRVWRMFSLWRTAFCYEMSLALSDVWVTCLACLVQYVVFDCMQQPAAMWDSLCCYLYSTGLAVFQYASWLRDDLRLLVAAH